MYGDKCCYIHPSIACKYGIYCTRIGCAYSHPAGFNPVGMYPNMIQYITSKKPKITLNTLEKNVVSIKKDLYEIVQYNDTKVIENIIDVSEGQKTVVNEIIYTNFLVNIYNITKFNEKSLSKRSNEELTEEINLYHSQLLIINMTRTNGTESTFIGGYLGFFSDTSNTENNDNNENNASDFEILEIEEDENEKTIIDDDFIKKPKMNHNQYQQ